MNPESESQEKISTCSGSTDTITDVDNIDDSAPSCSFISSKFDPLKALNTPNLCGDDVDSYEDLYALRNKAHSEVLLVTSHEGMEGVYGPGGFPIEKVKHVRHFTEDQAPLPGKARKPLRNVLTRMEEVQGPFAALRKCRDSQTRVKVYTRSFNEVRGIMTGYVVAFDKHWNLVLRDVDEIFLKKLKCKTPVFDDVENFTKVADLSLREETDPEYKDPTTDPTPLIWQNPFSKKAICSLESQPTVLTEYETPSLEMSSRSDRSDDDWETRRATRSTHGCRVVKAVLRGSSSLTKEAKALKLGRPTVWNEVTEYSSEKIKPGVESGEGQVKKVSKDELEEYFDKSEQSFKSSVNPKIGKRRKRKQSKMELRQRHVNQILVRGENVVLVNVLEV